MSSDRKYRINVETPTYKADQAKRYISLVNQLILQQ